MFVGKGSALLLLEAITRLLEINCSYGGVAGWSGQLVLEGASLHLQGVPHLWSHSGLRGAKWSHTKGPLMCCGEAPSKTDCFAPSSYATEIMASGTEERQGMGQEWRIAEKAVVPLLLCLKEEKFCFTNDQHQDCKESVVSSSLHPSSSCGLPRAKA